MSRPKEFIFEGYGFDYSSGNLELRYAIDDLWQFTETYDFSLNDEVGYDHKKVDALAFYLFIVCGTSYYKTFPARAFKLDAELSPQQVVFFNDMYSGGLSQYIYENSLSPDDMATFDRFASGTPRTLPVRHSEKEPKLLLMNSGGKDSLLSAELLKKSGKSYTSWHMNSKGDYPDVVAKSSSAVVTTKRSIDGPGLKKVAEAGALNGHIPFSAIYAGAAMLQAVLSGNNTVVASNESSADEANVEIDGFAVNHQHTKTFMVEQAIDTYFKTYVGADYSYVSLLRPLTELRVAELFSIYVWPEYMNDFSSCNLANYKQQQESDSLLWDRDCPKCANVYLLLAAFVDSGELDAVFAGENLLSKPTLKKTYKELMGLSDFKPFECVGTFDDLQAAYHMAAARDQRYRVEYDVPRPVGDYRTHGPAQSLVYELVSKDIFNSDLKARV